jgi:hypothetical protein
MDASHLIADELGGCGDAEGCHLVTAIARS